MEPSGHRSVLRAPSKDANLPVSAEMHSALCGALTAVRDEWSRHSYIYIHGGCTRQGLLLCMSRFLREPNTSASDLVLGSLKLVLHVEANAVRLAPSALVMHALRPSADDQSKVVC